MFTNLNRAYGEKKIKKNVQVISARQLVSKLVSHFELFVKSDIPIFSFHYLNNNKKI